MKAKVLIGVACISGLLGVVAMKLTSPSPDVQTFAKTNHAGLLLYAHLSNRITWIQGGVIHSVEGAGAHGLGHHAYPAISADGELVAFVRTGPQPHTEQIVVRKTTSGDETVLLDWPGSVWTTSWSPSRTLLAFVADRPTSAGRQSLYLVDTSTSHVTEFATDVRWVSVYSTPSWSPDGKRLAFERRFTEETGAEAQEVVLIEIDTRSIKKVADGWFPSWSPKGERLAYVSRDGRDCFELDIAKNERRTLFSYHDLLGDQTIMGPIVWVPSGTGVLFNVTSGMVGDQRTSYYYDLSSGKKMRIGHDPNFEMVGWAPQLKPTGQPKVVIPIQ